MAINLLETVQALQETLSLAAKQSLDRRFGALYDKVYRDDVLWQAWRNSPAVTCTVAGHDVWANK